MSTKPDAYRQFEEEPPINKAVNDVIAIAGGDPELEEKVIHAMISLCCERMAASLGRAKCRAALRQFDDFVRDARPVRPWPE